MRSHGRASRSVSDEHRGRNEEVLKKIPLFTQRCTSVRSSSDSGNSGFLDTASLEAGVDSAIHKFSGRRLRNQDALSQNTASDAA